MQKKLNKSFQYNWSNLSTQSQEAFNSIVVAIHKPYFLPEIYRAERESQIIQSPLKVFLLAQDKTIHICSRQSESKTFYSVWEKKKKIHRIELCITR